MEHMARPRNGIAALSASRRLRPDAGVPPDDLKCMLRADAHELGRFRILSRNVIKGPIERPPSGGLPFKRPSADVWHGRSRSSRARAS